jgi:hypothetical protein
MADGDKATIPGATVAWIVVVLALVAGAWWLRGWWGIGLIVVAGLVAVAALPRHKG